MKYTCKVMSLLLSVLMLLCCFAGCAVKDAEDAASSDADVASGKDTLVIATNAEFPPYEYYEGEEIVGIDVEIAAAIADKLGMDFTIKDMEFNAVITAVQNGEVSMGIAGMTVTEDRKKDVDFTDSYATGVQVVIVAEDSDITSVDDLLGDKNYTIGVQEGTTGDLYCTWDLEDEELATVERYSKGADAVLALSTGKVDCVVIDNEPAKVFVAANEGLKILDTEYAVEDYAICISKDDPELLEKVNTALNELIADGTVQSIIDKYISAD